MVTAIVIGSLLLVVASLVVVRLLSSLRKRSFVSPILLDEALDPDLRGLCQQLRRREDLSASDRSRFCHLIVSVAERRASGEASEADQRSVRRAMRALRSGATALERDIQTQEPNSA